MRCKMVYVKWLKNVKRKTSSGKSNEHPQDPQLCFTAHALRLLFEKLNLQYKKSA